VTMGLDIVHAMILAYSISVRELDQRLTTHYGPAGHEADAGKPITFRVLVEMRDDLGQLVTDCGWIVGTEYPKKGPIPDVTIHWFWDGLARHGTLNCGGSCVAGDSNGLAIDATDANGIARLVFQPKDEPNPGEGWVVEETGVVTGVALYQSRFTNLLGSYAQYLTPKSGATRWFVRYHEPPGYRVTMTVDYSLSALYYWAMSGREGNLHESYDWSGHVEYEFWLPADIVSNSEQSVMHDGSGSGRFSLIREDHTRLQAYTTWPLQCRGTWSGAWQHQLTVLSVSIRPNGQRYIDVQTRWPPLTLYSSTSDRPGYCPPERGDHITGRLTLEAPEFSLDARSPQTFQTATASICYDAHIWMYGGPNWWDAGGWSIQHCNADVTWRIEVAFSGPSGE
jgi:hypothetical protein